MRKELFLISFSILIMQHCFSQNDIIINNTTINNSEAHYGASNSITSPGSPATPTTINTGNKFVEYKSGNHIVLTPGFSVKADASGGLFKAYISPSFTPIPNSSAVQNDFKIGMFGFGVGAQGEPLFGGGCCNPVPYATFTDNSGTHPTSQLNALKEDGFNIVHQYGWPGEWSGSRGYNIDAMQLIKNNGLQIAVDGVNYFKPDATGLEGQNIYDGYNGLSYTDNNGNSGIYDYNTWHRAKPDLDDLIDNVYSSNNFSSTVWGYRMSEEASHAQANYMGINPDYCWDDCDQTKVRWIDCPAHNVADAIGHFKAHLNNQGVSNQKLVIMESMHGKSINNNSYFSDYSDGTKSCSICGTPNNSTLPVGMLQGYSQAQDYINPSIMGNNMPDVFFEGSYWYSNPNNWYSTPYSNIFNNGGHYLGMFKSIDYAYSQGVKNVQKVINDETYGGLFADDSHPNGAGLWFQAYNSIIHGAKGIWFWALKDSYDSPEDDTRITALNDVNNPLRFDRSNFPLKYQNFVRYLSKELAYLVGKNFLSTDPKSILYTKTDNADPNCIVPASSSYINGGLFQDILSNTPMAQYQTTSIQLARVVLDGESYGLRYTIRTNGDDVIMIISNPLPVPINNVMLNFNQLSNPKIKSSGGVDILFGDPSNGVSDWNYKNNRSNNIDLTNLTIGSGDTYYVPFWNNKQLQISFGPLDVKILRFVTSPNTPILSYENEWEKVWSNNGGNGFGSWLLRTDDHIVTGDFKGDGHEEILCTQQASSYASLQDFDTGDWKTIWSNNGNNAIGGTWLLRNTDILVSGDFDGDQKDELLCVQQTSAYASMYKYVNNSFAGIWSNLGNNAIGSWLIRNSDIIISGDFDGDKKDEILCIQNISHYATMLKYDGTSWQTMWSNGGSGYIDNWQITDNERYLVSDFDNDGQDEIVSLRNYYAPSATVLKFVPAHNDPVADPAWKQTNNDLIGIPNWKADLFYQAPPYFINTGSPLAGNIDYDGKAELMYIAYNGKSLTAEKTDDNNFTVNWNNNANPPYINDWQIPNTVADRYLLVKANKYSPKYLMAIRGDNTNCSPFLVNMYRSSDMTNKSLVSDETNKADSTKKNMNNILDNRIQLYPNPTTGDFYLSSFLNEQPITNIEVLNVVGEKISFEQRKTNTLITINLKDAPKGMYIVRLICGSNIYMKKIIYN